MLSLWFSVHSIAHTVTCCVDIHGVSLLNVPQVTEQEKDCMLQQTWPLQYLMTRMMNQSP